MIFLKFRTIFFQRFFRFFSPFFLFPTAFCSPPFFATIFLKLVRWKIFRFIGNFSTSGNFPIHLILLEKFPPSQFDLIIGTLKGPDIKWKIFRLIGNFSTSENFPIHLILLEKFAPSQFDLRIGTLKGPDIKWKIFRFIGNFSTSENFPPFFSHHFLFTPIFCHHFLKICKVETFPIYWKFFNF